MMTFRYESKALESYLRNISKNQPLPQEEEKKLIIKYRKGSYDAYQKLMKSNLKFVVSVARNYQNQGLPLTDLINEGNLGLHRALRKFNEDRNNKFISYAVWWIRQSILSALAEQSRIVRIPLNVVSLKNKINSTYSELTNKLGRFPKYDELTAEFKGVDKEALDIALQIQNNSTSLNETFEDDGKRELIDKIADNKTKETIEDMIDKNEDLRKIKKLFEILNEKERKIVEMNFGIGHQTSYTLEDIGKKFKLTRERVRQIREKAIKKMKHKLYSELRVSERNEAEYGLFPYSSEESPNKIENIQSTFFESER